MGCCSALARASAAGQAEIEQDHAAAGTHQDVRRFDVAVHDAGTMNRLHPADQLSGEREKALGRSPRPGVLAHGCRREQARRPIGERRAVHEFHGEEGCGIRGREQVQEFHQVRVADFRGDAEFVLEAVELVGRRLAQRFQCHFQAEFLIQHAKHRARTAVAEKGKLPEAWMMGEHAKEERRAGFSSGPRYAPSRRPEPASTSGNALHPAAVLLPGCSSRFPRGWYAGGPPESGGWLLGRSEPQH